MMWSEMIGRRLGDYEIVAEIGRGGGGARVYRGRVLSTGQPVAVKVIPNDAEERQLFVRRFQIETEVVRALHHPNIVAVYDAGETDELVYLVMQWVAGGTLRQRIVEGALDQTQVIRYAIQMAHALHHAHQQGVVHRDVKPSNMLLDADAPDHLLLADFGIAKIQGLRGITKSGMTVGTPEYMAPEQVENRESDPRSDIYSLGCVVYELLTGRPPFTAASSISVLYQQVHAHPAYIRAYNPAVPKGLCRVVEVALAKNPDGRFPTAAHFARALAPFLQPGYEGASSEPLTQVTLPPMAVVPRHVEAERAQGSSAAGIPRDIASGPFPLGAAGPLPLTREAPPESGPLGPWPLLLSREPDAEGTAAVVHEDAGAVEEEETIRLRVASQAQVSAQANGAAATQPDTAPDIVTDIVTDTEGVQGNAMQPDPPTGQTLAPRSTLPSRPTPGSQARSAAPRVAARTTSRPVMAEGATFGPARQTVDPALASEESAVWPRTIALTGAPSLQMPARRSRGVRVVLGLVAAIALLLAASLAASATGLITLPRPSTQQAPQAALTSTTLPTALPTGTVTLAPTPTQAAATPATIQQPLADQLAYNSFRAVTLAGSPDGSCSAASASSSFASGARIYINLCTSGSVAASSISIAVRQTGNVICTLSPVQAGKSYDCYSDYVLAPGRYDLVVTMKVNGTQATARDLRFMITG